MTEAFSASALEAFERCERRWAWDKIDGVRGPETEPMKLGTAVHKHLEDWLQSGIPPPKGTRAGDIARSGLHHLPPAGARTNLVETWFKRAHPSGVTFHGRIDLIDRRPPPRVTDHKTTSNIARWGKTESVLTTDLQAGIYAWATDIRNLKWVYYQTSGERSKSVEVELSEAEVEATMARAVALALRIQHIRRSGVRTALQLAPNPNACSDYNGCPHIERCNLTTEEKVFSIMSNPTDLAAIAQNFVNDVRHKQGQGAPAPGQINPQPQGAPAAVHTLPDGSWIDQNGAMHAPPQGQFSPQGQGQPQYAPPQYAPPQGQPQYTPPQGQPQYTPHAPQAQFAPQDQPQHAHPQNFSLPPGYQPPAGYQQAVSEPAPSAPKRGPGRPKKVNAPPPMGPQVQPQPDGEDEWGWLADGLEAFAAAIRNR